MEWSASLASSTSTGAKGSNELLMEFGELNSEFLYQISLASGLGSNPIGLDRGQLGSTYILEARRFGNRLLLVEPNYRYRATSDNPAERGAVADAFAPSTHWSFEIMAETDGRVLVNATSFFVRDAHGVAGTIRRSDQGSFRLDNDRSVILRENTNGFPLNTEVETWLTFTSDSPGFLVNSTAASGEAISLRQHHSFVSLPEPGYEPRLRDPRVGYFGITFSDYSTPITQPLQQSWISRHRLIKRNPGREMSEPVEPIIYYLDPGTPEPVRSALIEGGNWWNEAFEAAGFIDAFRVEVLPEGADPSDIRYNMIHWTHRSTRGWSYGGSVVDPRTGEIIKGNVNLGSLRLRQDFLLAQGMLSPFNASCDACAGPVGDHLARTEEDATALALARVRQLSAHEIGHTIGLAHNFIASSYDRGSVMDYPAPLVLIDGDELDLSSAYDSGIGEYDSFAIRWGYSQFPEGTDEQAALEAIIREGLDAGLTYVTEADSRSRAAAHPFSSLWDNGSDPVAWLDYEMDVRRIALSNFGETAVRRGEPMSRLQAVLVPTYLHHRYQVEAASKSIAGVEFYYNLRGDGQPGPGIVFGKQFKGAELL